jgi:hypothetical protein
VSLVLPGIKPAPGDAYVFDRSFRHSAQSIFQPQRDQGYRGGITILRD